MRVDTRHECTHRAAPGLLLPPHKLLLLLLLLLHSAAHRALHPDAPISQPTAPHTPPLMIIAGLTAGSLPLRILYHPAEPVHRLRQDQLVHRCTQIQHKKWW